MLKASGIPDDFIAARGHRTVTDKAELLQLGFKGYQARTPCLLVPIHAPGGEIGYHIRPDTPRLQKERQTEQVRVPPRLAKPLGRSTVREAADRRPERYTMDHRRLQKGRCAAAHGVCC